MKSPEEIFDCLKEEFVETGLSFHPAEKGQPWMTVPGLAVMNICKFLRDDRQLLFDTLMCLSGVHYPDEEMLGVTYHLCSTVHGHALAMKVKVPAEDARVESVESVWKTADWHEREAFDMFGIIFENHPDLTRILCPEDWEGHPLRKDYNPPEFYHDLKVSY